MSEPQGFVSLVLHSHLPFVRHPEHEHFLEERWLFEALTETYLPLLERLQRVATDHLPCRITMSFTPTLLAMLGDPLLQGRYVRHVDQLIELSAKEIERTRWQPPFHRLAWFYHHRFTTARQQFVDGHHRNILPAFRQLMEAGTLEGLASCATHGFLPLMDTQPAAVRAQMRIGVQAFEHAFGRRPAGMWLPECGYHPGHDRFLKELGIRYFLVDAHGVLFGSPRPKYGVYAPVFCPSGVAAFGRDLESSKSVWSAEEGYPGHPDYREFYRDIGFDVDYDYLRPYLNGDGARVQTGLKYYRITNKPVAGQPEDKAPYDPDRAQERAAEHAGNFMFNREKQIEHLRSMLDRQPLVVSPYDTELFGHWWFEGPDWLEFLIRKTAHDQQTFQLISPSQYLDRYPKNQVIQPCMSSWGHQGYHEVWLNGANDWIYRHLHKMSERMTERARQHPHASGLLERGLNQLARELLLAQASDWAFILKTGTHTTYAYQRMRDHLARFSRLYEAIGHGTVDESVLAPVEASDNCFPFLNYRVYGESAEAATR
jgi:1,4-alpha-glucan branching enzyme